jgi:hypothetical protein
MPESHTVFVRRAEWDDLMLLFEWANDPLVRANSFTPESILPATHFEWFSRVLKDPDCLLLIVLAGGGAPIGQARFNRVSRVGRRSRSRWLRNGAAAELAPRHSR